MTNKLRARLVVVGLALAATAFSPGSAASADTASLPTPHLSPASVEAGRGFTMAGAGCRPVRRGSLSGSFELSVNSPNEGFGAGGSTDSLGSWHIVVRVPNTFANGVYPVHASCHLGKTTQRYPTVYLTVGARVRPVVHLSTTSALPGETVTVQAIGFGAKEQVEFALSSGALLGITTTDLDGSVTTNVSVPLGLQAGLHHVEVAGLTSGTRASAGLHVLAPTGCPVRECDPTAPTPPPLANTGASTMDAMLFGAVLLVLGSAFLAAGQRRPRQEDFK
jgi:hypothetical protein